MLEDLIILINDIHTTVTTYWEKHPTFTSIIGGLIGLRILWLAFTSARRLIKVITNKA